MSIKFEGNAKGIISAINNGTRAGLVASSELVLSQAKALAPVDTGQLRDTMFYMANDKEATVGSALDYSEVVEFRQAYLRPAFRENKNNIIDILGKAVRVEVE